MKIRNLPFNELNDKEKKVVCAHRKEQLDDIGSDCRNQVCNNSVEEFWEMHREIDTDYGNFDGWIEPENLERDGD